MSEDSEARAHDPEPVCDEGAEGGRHGPAPLGRRVLAFLGDLIVIYGLTGILGWLVSGLWALHPVGRIVLFATVWLAYFGSTEASGGSPLKRKLGLGVVDRRGDAPGHGRALARATLLLPCFTGHGQELLGWVAPTTTAVLGAAVLAWGLASLFLVLVARPWRQAPYGWLTGTWVVCTGGVTRAVPESAGRRWVVGAVLVAMVSLAASVFLYAKFDLQQRDPQLVALHRQLSQEPEVRWAELGWMWMLGDKGGRRFEVQVFVDEQPLDAESFLGKLGRHVASLESAGLAREWVEISACWAEDGGCRRGVRCASATATVAGWGASSSATDADPGDDSAGPPSQH